MKAAALQGYLSQPRRIIRARLLRVATMKDGAHVLDVNVDVDLPQQPVCDIRATEPVRIVMPSGDALPLVHSRRKDFPVVAHTMVAEARGLRHLCLYQRPWSDERANWTPRLFTELIRHWFQATADGTLHPHDQDLEPVMQNSPLRLVLPETRGAPAQGCRVDRLFVGRRAEGYWLAYHDRPPGLAPDTRTTPIIVVRGPTVHHGLMHKLPAHLGELDEMLTGLGQSLVDTISTQIASLRAELAPHAKQPLILVVELPKTRHISGKTESVERRAFFLGQNIGELFATRRTQVLNNGIFVPKDEELFCDRTRLANVPLMPFSVRTHLTPASAAKMNGLPLQPQKILAIGAGALGSQLTNNLWRGGFGEWTLVEDDDLEAHNPARHLLTSADVGVNKAEAVARELQAVFPDRPPPTVIACNYLQPGASEPTLKAAIGNADIVMDFSASVSVERAVANDSRSSRRRLSAFLNQRGDEAVLLVEDEMRRCDLFWLEALYYHGAATRDDLAGHFDSVGAVAHRYGNGCREISAVVPQDGIALHSALLSHAIRRAVAASDAAVTVHRWTRTDNTVAKIVVTVSPPVHCLVGGWQVQILPDALMGMRELRMTNLPNETGGVLVGLVDREHRRIAILCALPAPPDSQAWPTSFIRGSNGLAAQVERFGRRSLQNLTYVGEWHSHPDGCSSRPSLDDIAAIALSAPHTQADRLPTLMLIVAQKEVRLLLQGGAGEDISTETIPAKRLPQ